MTEQPYNILQKLPYIHLIYSTADLPQFSEQAIARQIQSVGSLQRPEVNIKWEMMALARVLGRIQFDNHEIHIAGLGQPLSPEVVDRTILASQWQPQIKAAMRQHQSHLSLVYAGQSHDPIEKMIALYKVARAFRNENSLGIVNENAWTAHPVADTLSPEQITSYRENLPFALWMGYIKIFTDPEHFWWVTKGHHLFDVPDLAYFVHPGEDENAQDIDNLANPGRDATILTIARVNLETLNDPGLLLPSYEIIYFQSWIGVKHTDLYGAVLSLAATWQVKHIICDATGVGAGFTSFLARRFGGKVIPFTFNSRTKSDLGWSFLALVDTDRLKVYAQDPTTYDSLNKLHDLFFLQLQNIQYEILPGPDKKIKWSVPESARDLNTGDLIHDDLVLSAALLSILDQQSWSVSAPAAVLKAADPLDDMKGF